MQDEININTATRICQELESKLIPLGFHVALTGSVLYGKQASRKKYNPYPCDLDVIIYRHNKKSDLEITMIFDEYLLETVGLHPRPWADAYRRKVYKCTYEDGTLVDVFYLD